MDNTPVLGLRTNIGTDPFLRADFVFNWGLLDSAPGVAKGSSGDRSALTWGTDQAGRLFLEEETQRLMQWTGTAWVDVLQNSESFANVISHGAALGTPTASSATYSFPSITLIRPGRLVGTMTLRFNAQVNQQVFLGIYPYISVAGTSTSIALGTAEFRRIPWSSTNTSAEDGMITAPFRSGIIPAGAAIPQIRVTAAAGNLAVCDNAQYSAVIAN